MRILPRRQILDIWRSDVTDRSMRPRLEEIAYHLKRARELRHRRTSTSIALVERALRLLDALEEADQDAGRGR